MAAITATEFKENLGKYLSLCEKEDIYISKNGKIIAKLSNPYTKTTDEIESLFGIISKDK